MTRKLNVPPRPQSVNCISGEPRFTIGWGGPLCEFSLASTPQCCDTGVVHRTVRPTNVNLGKGPVDTASPLASAVSQRRLPTSASSRTKRDDAAKPESGPRAAHQLRMRYPPALCEKILLLHEQGLSGRQIARCISKHPFCVHRFLRTARGRPTAGKATHHGPTRALSIRDERAAKRLVLSGFVDTAAELSRHAAELGLPTVSADKFSRALRRQGLVARIKPRKPGLTESHMRRRLAWARQHRHWTAADWARVIFCDETKHLRVNASSRLWCWRRW